MIKLVTLLAWTLFVLSSQTTAAAEKCFDWKRLQDGQWFVQCQDEKARATCYICKTKQIASTCVRREGSKCAA
jgi:hypothetical protein